MGMRTLGRIVGTILPAGLALCGVTACQSPSTTTTAAVEITPAPPALPKLTRAQYTNSIHDVLGESLVVPSVLEPDVPFDALYSVGASVAKTSPRGVELYEDGARSLSAQIAGKPELLAAVLPCAPTSSTDGACLQQFVAKTGRRLWRRSLTAAEVSAIVGVGLQGGDKLAAFPHAVEYALIALLQSPNFLYRAEAGEVDPIHGGFRLTGVELAARLAFFLWNGPPDEALLDAAETGTLATTDGLEAQVTRMVADPKLRRAVRNFGDDWLELQAVLDLSKDPKVYKHFSSDLGASARSETLALLEYLALDKDADMRELLTTKTTFVDRRLAAIYDVPALTDTGLAQVELPPGERQGLLGHVSFLGLRAHPTSSSPTIRGRFVREILLCDQVPNPPAGFNTALPEQNAAANTMRERLSVHMQVPSCKGCHSFIDPIGLGLEHFDGVGRYRTTENGASIDTTGTLDDVAFADLATLANDVAQSPKYAACITRKLYGYAVSRPVVDGEKPLLDALAVQFVSGGLKLKQLMRDVALSDGFSRIGPRDTAVAGGTP